MQITRDTAETAAEWLRHYGTPEAAMHQIRVQLTAIRPYSSRDLDKAHAALAFCARGIGEMRDKRLAQLLELSHRPARACRTDGRDAYSVSEGARQEANRYATADEAIRPHERCDIWRDRSKG